MSGCVLVCVVYIVGVCTSVCGVYSGGCDEWVCTSVDTLRPS